jgi:hypothetical protein
MRPRRRRTAGRDGLLGPADEVVVFNTGSGASYRSEAVDLPAGAAATMG